MENKYYVYTVSVDNEVVYVGKGKNDRAEHVTSGCSHNKGLNELYFRHKLLGEDLPLVEIYSSVSENVALAEEHLLVKRYNPRCNSALKNTDVKLYNHWDDGDILRYMEENWDTRSFRDIPESTGLSNDQKDWIYENICGHEILYDEEILSIAVSHSNLYGKEISCEFVRALSQVRDTREGR